MTPSRVVCVSVFLCLAQVAVAQEGHDEEPMPEEPGPATSQPTTSPETPPPALPSPEEAAQDAEHSAPAAPEPQAPPAAKPPGPTGPEARPYFIKGGLASGGVHALTQQDFLGVSAGISALPTNADTVLNSFFLTVEPQIDLMLEWRELKLGLGIPLQFELLDTRGAFERCVDQAKSAYSSAVGTDEMKAQNAATAAKDCVDDEKQNATNNFFALRKADWDEPSDYAKVIRYLRIGGEEKPFYLNVSRLYGQSLGHGVVVRRYNPNLDYNTARVGMTLDAFRGPLGFESMINDVVNPDVFGVLGFVRPFATLFPNSTLLRSLSFGVSATVGREVPKSIEFEEGVLEPSAGVPIPAVDAKGNIKVAEDNLETVSILGVDVETKLIRTQWADLKVYGDYQKIADHGGGYTLGTLWRFSFGQPAFSALRIVAELNYFDPDYLPSFFDSMYDIQKVQYLPAGYTSADKNMNDHTYYPTKLGYLEANRGGKKRIGGYVEATHSLFNLLTVGVAARASTPTGDPKTAGFMGPEFTNWGACSFTGEGAARKLDCDAAGKSAAVDAGYSSVLLHAEIPFRKYLQAFATYEVFSTSAPVESGGEREGLDFFQWDGDNEVFFGGLRLQILPVVFVQAEARRFFFLQRVTNVNLDEISAEATEFPLEQDQNYHSEWTAAINLYAGLEF
jgi:hypothetical protein